MRCIFLRRIYLPPSHHTYVRLDLHHNRAQNRVKSRPETDLRHNRAQNRVKSRPETDLRHNTGQNQVKRRPPIKENRHLLNVKRWRQDIRCPRLTRHETGTGSVLFHILNQADGVAFIALIIPFHLYLGTPDLKTHRTSCIGASAGPVETDYSLIILIPIRSQRIITLIPLPCRGQDNNTGSLHCGEVISSI